MLSQYILDTITAGGLSYLIFVEDIDDKIQIFLRKSINSNDNFCTDMQETLGCMGVRQILTRKPKYCLEMKLEHKTKVIFLDRIFVFSLKYRKNNIHGYGI